MTALQRLRPAPAPAAASLTTAQPTFVGPTPAFLQPKPPTGPQAPGPSAETIQAVLAAIEHIKAQGGPIIGIPVPPPVDPVRAAQYAGLLRAFMPAIGGLLAIFGLAVPQFTDAQLAAYIQLGLTIAGMVGAGWWSWQQKKQARSKEVATAIASADAGKPVTVTVTPGLAPNVVVPVSNAELAAAPPVP